MFSLLQLPSAGTVLDHKVVSIHAFFLKHMQNPSPEMCLHECVTCRRYTCMDGQMDKWMHGLDAVVLNPVLRDPLSCLF